MILFLKSFRRFVSGFEFINTRTSSTKDINFPVISIVQWLTNVNTKASNVTCTDRDSRYAWHQSTITAVRCNNQVEYFVCLSIEFHSLADRSSRCWLWPLLGESSKWGNCLRTNHSLGHFRFTLPIFALSSPCALRKAWGSLDLSCTLVG